MEGSSATQKTHSTSAPRVTPLKLISPLSNDYDGYCIYRISSLRRDDGRRPLTHQLSRRRNKSCLSPQPSNNGRGNYTEDDQSDSKQEVSLSPQKKLALKNDGMARLVIWSPEIDILWIEEEDRYFREFCEIGFRGKSQEYGPPTDGWWLGGGVV